MWPWGQACFCMYLWKDNFMYLKPVINDFHIKIMPFLKLESKIIGHVSQLSDPKWKKRYLHVLWISRQTGLSKQCQPRLDCWKLGAVWSGCTLSAILPASFECTTLWKNHIVQILWQLQQLFWLSDVFFLFTVYFYKNNAVPKRTNSQKGPILYKKHKK